MLGRVLTHNPVNRGHDLNRGLVAWYLNTPWNGGGRYWYDLAGSRHSPYNAAPAVGYGFQPTTYRPGGFGAMSYDGATASWHDTGFRVENVTAGYGTVSWWFNGVSGYRAMWQAPPVGGEFVAQLYGTTYYVGFNGGSLGSDQRAIVDGAATGYAIGVWRFFTFTWYPSGSSLFIDGKFAGAGGVGTNTPGANIQLGNMSGTAIANGQMDSWRLQNVALSATEVWELYQEERGGYPTLLNREPSRASILFRPSVLFAGTAAGLSTVAGSLSVSTSLSATAAGLSTVAGSMSASTSLSGAAAGASAVAGSMLVSTSLSGTAAGASAVSGAFRVLSIPAKLRESIIAALKADPGVAALVGARVEPLVVDQSSRFPAIAVQVISIDRPRHLAGPNNIVAARVQIAAVSKLLSDTAFTAEAVRQALDGFSGALGTGVNVVTVVETVLLAERDLPDDAADGTGKPYLRTVCEYLIRYREPAPARLS